VIDQAYPPPPPPLRVPVADSHCHLDIGRDGPPPSVEEALAAARAVGVTTLIQIGCELASAAWAAETAGAYDDIWAGVALHPNEAPRIAGGGPGELEAAYGVIDDLAVLPQVVAIGETGLDYFRTGLDGRDVQQASFRRHIALAKQHHLALVIHDREAHADVLRILDEEEPPERVVLHCYSGDAAMAATCAARGYYLSFAGTVTFANAPDLRAALAVTPRDRVLVETDAPYLTPAPHRGRPNAPYLIPHTLRAMANVLRTPEDELAGAVMANTVAAFELPPPG
jgi:TatD DNase family protein